jgi:hypothetical protein
MINLKVCAGKNNKHRAQETPMKLKKVRRVGNWDL